jgi:LuxR family maltose regulon positive regulatory protein
LASGTLRSVNLARCSVMRAKRSEPVPAEKWCLKPGSDGGRSVDLHPATSRSGSSSTLVTRPLPPQPVATHGANVFRLNSPPLHSPGKPVRALEAGGVASTGMSAQARSNVFDTGARALACGDWERARAAFEAALNEEETAEALEGLGMAAWWLDDAATTFDARERAYRLYRERGERVAAARLARWLAWDYNAFRGEPAVANGWLRRAHRLLDGIDAGAEHGWLALREGEIALLLGNDPSKARELAATAAELGRSLGVIDLEMVGLALEGLALVSEGRVEEGMPRLDEATTAAVAGELEDLNAVGAACCYLIFACERVRDFDRAAQWCERVQEFCRRWRIRPLFAVCRTHYAAVLVWRGAWAEAEAELLGATGELEATRPAMAVEGLVRLGELRRRQGRSEEAADLFRLVELHPLAQLGQAALALDRGDARSAIDLAERYLRRLSPDDRTERVPALELIVRAHATRGHIDEARQALIELEAIAATVGTDPLRASAALAAGVVAGAEADDEYARRCLEDALALFQRSGAPFETATTRIELARALTRLGRVDGADEEALRARETLNALGARTETILDSLGEKRLSPLGLSRRELDVLRLIAVGLSNRDIAERLIVSEHTVHRHVANIFRKLGVSSRSAAAAVAAKHQVI